MDNKLKFNFLYGDDYSRKAEKLDEQVTELQAKYADVLEDKELTSCYILTIVGVNQVIFRITDISIPQNIQDEMVRLFNTNFPNN